MKKLTFAGFLGAWILAFGSGHAQIQHSLDEELKSLKEVLKELGESMNRVHQLEDRVDIMRRHFDGLDTQARSILVQVSENSSFMDALDASGRRLAVLQKRFEADVNASGGEDARALRRVERIQQTRQDFTEQINIVHKIELDIVDLLFENSGFIRNLQLNDTISSGAEEVLKNGAEEVQNAVGRMRGISDAVRRIDIDVLVWLKAQGFNITQDFVTGTPMHYAASGNAVDSIKWLKSLGFDINARDNNDGTPMHHAARANAEDAMKWLIALGADISVLNFDGETPMHYAASGNAVDAMNWLMTKGVDINVRDADSQTPMHKAASKGAVGAMNWLMAKGADINARDSNGQTPMHKAASKGAVDAMNWLMAKGADINARDSNGQTPMHDDLGTIQP